MKNKKDFKMNLQLFGSPSNQQIIEKGRTLATGQTDGMLNPEQSERFMQMVFDEATFLNSLRHEMRRSTKGTIEKLGVGRRLLRPKQEAEILDEKDWVEPVLGAIPYSTIDIVLSAEISEKFLRENIERQGFEDTFMGMIAKQVQIDILDLVFNGDTAATGTDAAFLGISDGYIKQLKTGTHILDAATLNSGNYTDEIFTRGLKMLPTKYFNRNSYRWIANSNTYITWIEYLRQRETTAGDMAILNGQNLNPLGIDWAEVPNFPDGLIILANPYNFTVVNTYNERY